jgi:hypothetical protein
VRAVIVHPTSLPSNEALTTPVGVPPVFRRIVALSLPTGGGADALVVDPESTKLAGSFGQVDFFAPAAAISAPSGGVFTVTLGAALQVRAVTLKQSPSGKISLIRLDGAKQAPPTATRTQGQAFDDPPADFTDRRFAVRAETAAGVPDASAGLDKITLRSRPIRARLALSAPGQEAVAVAFWSGPPTPGAVTVTGAAPAFAAALQAYLGALAAPPGAAVAVSLVAESDAPCTLTLTQVAAGYRLVRARFAGEHSGKPKAVLRFRAGTVAPAAVAVELPGGADVVAASVATSEALPAALPPSGDWTARAADLGGVKRGVHVVPGHPAAARLEAGGGVRASRVALGVHVLEAPAELQVQLVADRDSEPSGPPLAEGSIAIAGADRRAGPTPSGTAVSTGAAAVSSPGQAGPAPNGAAGLAAAISAGRRAWVTAAIGELPLPAGTAYWIVLSAARGAVVWLAGAGPPETVVRGRDGEALAGLAVLAELLAAPVALEAAVETATPLALAVGDVAVASPPATTGARTFEITAALHAQPAGAPVPLTFRAVGPGNVTVYPPRVEYDLD